MAGPSSTFLHPIPHAISIHPPLSYTAGPPRCTPPHRLSGAQIFIILLTRALHGPNGVVVSGWVLRCLAAHKRASYIIIDYWEYTATTKTTTLTIACRNAAGSPNRWNARGKRLWYGSHGQGRRCGSVNRFHECIWPGKERKWCIWTIILLRV